jgi:hypothetical protein
MYKALCVALLLATTFTVFPLGKAADTSAPIPNTATPVILARGKMLNQTAPIPSTTILTPATTGLFRLSIYATVTTIDSSSQSSWGILPQWTDDAATQYAGGILIGYGSVLGQFESQGDAQIGGVSTSFEAKAGTPITISTYQNGPPDSSVYAMYYVLERLE